MLARFLGIAVNAQQLEHQLAGTRLGTTEILRYARQFQLRARNIDSDWQRLKKTALPAIAERHDGSFFIIGKIAVERFFTCQT
jgi:subfamily B ATP-binding cassette protein HlyB/CyaB